MLNFLYCFDENYNQMGFTSIISLLDSIGEKINIHIIHKLEETKKFIPNIISNHKNLNEINVFSFDRSFDHFPNVEKSHISEATYYRLFLEDYLRDDDFYVYLDADVVCLDDPIPYIKSKIKLMGQNKIPIAAMKHEEILQNDQRSLKLGISNGNYFNAGVMVINTRVWNKYCVKDQAIKIIKDKNEELYLWDQDVLNIIFSGNYEKIDNNYNYRMNLLNFENEEKAYIDNNVYLIHYYGKSKPWTIRGIGFGVSEYYQENYRKIFKDKYHITHIWRFNSLLFLLKLVFSKNFFNLKYPLKFLKNSIYSFFR